MRRRKWSQLPEGRKYVALNYRTGTILCGSAVNCLTAIVSISSFLTVWSVLHSRDLKDVAMFPWWIWAVTLFAGPFSVIAGLIGMSVLTRVRLHRPSIRGYLVEATALGSLLGAFYPAVAYALHLTGFATWGFLALGAGSGAICGLIVGYLSIRRVRLPKVTS